MITVSLTFSSESYKYMGYNTIVSVLFQYYVFIFYCIVSLANPSPFGEFLGNLSELPTIQCGKFRIFLNENRGLFSDIKWQKFMY